MADYVPLCRDMSWYGSVCLRMTKCGEYGQAEYVHIWPSMRECSRVWASMTMNSPILQFVAEYGQLWPIIDQVSVTIAEYGTIWPTMTNMGYLCPNMSLYDRVCPSLACGSRSGMAEYVRVESSITKCDRLRPFIAKYSRVWGTKYGISLTDESIS